tara:strand:+ start:3271 stop:3453 length:183 start_codon:yes stop_codon:yes gene_type:complete
MKTLKHKEAGNLKRSPDKEATRMILTGEWEYVPKSVWKKEVRDVKVSKSSKTQKRQTKKH